MNPNYQQELSAALMEGATILYDGPTGTLVELPKKMRTQTKVALWVGVVLLLAYMLGLFVILFAVIDYGMQKKPRRLISR